MRKIIYVIGIAGAVGMLLAGCNNNQKEMHGEKITKQVNVNDLQLTKRKEVQYTDGKIDILKNIDNLQGVVKELNLSNLNRDKDEVVKKYAAEGIKIKYTADRDLYPELDVKITKNKDVNVNGYGINSTISYYMDGVFEKRGWNVEKDGRMNNKRNVTFCKVYDDKVVHIEFNSKPDITTDEIKVYTKKNTRKCKTLIKNQITVADLYEMELMHLQLEEDQLNVRFIQAGSRFYPCMVVWGNIDGYNCMNFYYSTNKNRVKSITEIKGVKYNNNGIIKIVNINGQDIYKYKNRKLKQIEKLEYDDDGYYINNRKVSENKYYEECNKYDSDKDIYISQHANGSSYGGYDDRREAISMLNKGFNSLDE